MNHTGNTGPSKSESAPFQMWGLFFYHIHELIKAKSESYILGEITQWSRCLKALYRHIYFKIDEADRDLLDEFFGKAENCINLNVDIPKGLMRKMYGPTTEEAIRHLHFIDCQLMVIMDKKKMIFPPKGLQGIEKIRERYGLNIKKNEPVS